MNVWCRTEINMSQLFDCDICGQEAMTEPNLRTHMVLEHEENASCCPLCDLQDVSLDELNLHVNTAHAEVLSPQRVGSDNAISSSESKVSSKQVEQPLILSHLKEEKRLHNRDVTCAPVRITEQSSLDPHETFHPDKFDTNAASRNCICNERNGIAVEGAEATSKSTNETRSPLHPAPQICACNFNQSDCQDSNGSGLSQVSQDCDTQATNSHSNWAASRTGNTDIQDACKDDQSIHTDHDAPAVFDRKRTRSKTELMSCDSVVVINCSSEVSSRRTSSSSASSTVSPLKKFFRFFSPQKAEKTMGKKEIEHLDAAVGGSSASKLNGIWSQDQRRDSQSEPECPFCDASGEDMVHHVECEHVDVLVSSGPSGTPTQNGYQWNTSMMQKSNGPKTPKPTLLSLSKQAYNLQSIITCPICGLGSYDPDFLTVHINTEHPTPDDGNKTTWSTQLEDQPGPSSNNIAHLTPSDASCPVCGLSGLDATSLNKHVEGHFEVQNQDSFSGDHQLAKQLAEEEKQLQERRQREAFKQLQVKYGMDESRSYKQQSEQDLETAVVRGQITVADYNQQRASLRQSLAVGVDDGKSRTSGLIHKMLTFYTEHKTQGLSYVRLCSETDHFSSTYGDKGWGCGYRNLQIMLSSLVHDTEYRRVLFSGREAIPSISKLQQLIETAWAKGFDPQGREQLGSRVVNTRKWIGATEIVAVLSYLRAKCRLIDFHTPTGPGDTHPALFQWVRDYFGKPAMTALRHRLLSGNGIKAETIRTKKTPLYLQHEGHSRTIVGCEIHKDDSIRLLLFDPSYKVNDMRGLGMTNLDSYAMQPLRKSLSQMKAKQYQIVIVDGLITSEREYEQRKILRSERKP